MEENGGCERKEEAAGLGYLEGIQEGIWEEKVVGKEIFLF